MVIEDIKITKSNCEEYAHFGKSVEVLRNANGKNDYKKIAKILGMHPTSVSSLLKKAENMGLVVRIERGIYKKKPGVLGYMPTKDMIAKVDGRTVPNIINRINKKNKSKKSTFLPSFTVSNKVFINTNKMFNAYGNLYIVENTLRDLIRKTLEKKVDWWKKNVPSGIQADVEDAINRAPYHAVIRNDRLEYAHLGQLKEIIIYRKNWNDFMPYLNTKDKNDFSATINKAIPSRNAVGHCIPLQAKDLKVVDVRFEDILKMIK